MKTLPLLIALAVMLPPGTCMADAYDPPDDPLVRRPIYPVWKWPQDIASVPCAAWKKNDLGAWELSGSLDWTGGDLRVVSPSYQVTTPEGAIVEEKCAATTK